MTTVQNTAFGPEIDGEEILGAPDAFADAPAQTAVAGQEFTGTNGADLIRGTADDDTIEGLGGRDTIFGEGGDDLILFATGDNRIFDGGEGEDTIRLVGGSGDEFRNDTAVSIEHIEVDLNNGNNGIMRFNAAQFPDLTSIASLNPANAVFVEVFADTETLVDMSSARVSLAGFDNPNDEFRIFGDNDAETILGSDIRDEIDGNEGNDILSGNGGDDLIDGDGGNDLLRGGAGNDHLRGGNDLDTLAGNSGDDSLEGGNGDDLLFGGTGEDTLRGGAGSDRLDGGAGADLIDGSDGADTVDYSRSSEAVHVQLNLGSGDAGSGLGGDAEGDQIFRVENGIGSAFGDFFRGSNGVNVFNTGAGNDTIEGLGDRDSIFGEDGDDVIIFTTGANRLFDGGDGEDTIRLTGNSGDDLRDDTITSIEHVEIDFDLGVNAIFRSNADQLAEVTSIASMQPGNGVTVDIRADDATVIDFSADRVETIGFFNRDDVFLFTGDNDAEIFRGTEIRDEISAGGGDDVLEGNGGNDVLRGNDGNDTLNGGTGADTIDGGNGFDIVDYSTSSAAVNLRINQGSSDFGTGTGGDSLGDFIFRMEGAIGTAFDDRLTGNNGANLFNGGDGDDTIEGLGGRDTIFGDDGDDVIIYSFGDSRVFDGGDGVDAIRLTGNTSDNLRNDTIVSIERVEIDFNTGFNGIFQTNADQIAGVTAFSSLNAANAVFVEIFADDATRIDVSSGRVALNGFDNPGDEFRLFGDADAETILGSDIRDEVSGGSGNDNISGNGGDDLLDGDNGNDILRGGDGDDLLRGGSGSDTLAGNDGNDSLEGGNEEDLLYGGAGDDTLRGGSANDRLVGGAGADVIDGGDSLNDTVDYSGSSAGVQVELNIGDNDAGTGIGGDAEGDLIFRTESAIGSAFDDRFRGSNSANVFTAGAGDDTIEGLGGRDTIFGDDGDDLILYSTGNNRIFNGGAGEDTIRLVGGSGDDFRDDTAESIEHIEVGLNNGNNGIMRFNAAQFPDLTSIASLNPANTVVVEVFADTATRVDMSSARVSLSGFDNPNDEFRIFGDDDAETILGSDIRDEIDGNEGNDILSGNGGDDLIDGDGGNDLLRGGAGNDHLRGGNDADTLAGNDGADSLEGGNGDDLLFGGTGDDTLRGGAGSDRLDGGAGADLIDGSDGADTVDYSRSSAGVQVQLNLGSSDAGSGLGGDAEGDRIFRVENGIGSAFGDSFRGSNGVNVFNTGAGNDTIDGLAGRDSVFGEDGDDLILFSRGDTRLFDGGNGEDTIRLLGNAGDDLRDDTIASVEHIEFDLNDGIVGNVSMNADQFPDLASLTKVNATTDVFLTVFANELTEIDLSSGTVSLVGFDGPGDQINVVGDDDAETILGTDISDDITGAGGNDILSGNGGDDTLNGDDGADLLRGGDGDDSLSGGNDADTIAGNDGADTLEGGEGNDALFGGSGDDSLEGGLGADTLAGGAGADSLFGEDGNDLLLGEDGDDSLVGGNGEDDLRGDAGNDTIDAGIGNDLLRGGNGNDSLLGGDGADTLAGNDGNDTLQGGGGDDRLIGGVGADVLSGGIGADVFVFADVTQSPDGADRDIIDDFVIGVDLIDLSGFGGLTFAAGGFTGAGNEVSFDEGLSRLFVDVDGDQAADFSVDLINEPGQLTASDLIL